MTRANGSRAELVRTMARLLRDQGYNATGLAQVLSESGVSNGSLYHHFPGGKEDLAEAAIEASGLAVSDALTVALDGAPNVGAGVASFLDQAAELLLENPCAGCPVAPTALEAPLVGERLQAAATRCFESWRALLASRLRDDGWPEDSVRGGASVALTLIEGALLQARVTGETDHLNYARSAATTMLSTAPPGPAEVRVATGDAYGMPTRRDGPES